MPQIRFDIITLFPDFFQTPLKSSLLGKAIKEGSVVVNFINLRDSGQGKHKQVDDRPFGGGPGMVLKADVLATSLKKVSQTRTKEKPLVILLDPSGTPLKQEKVEKLSKRGWIILICGRYEGVDERFKAKYVDEAISVGDYVLNGGEAAALVVLDAVSRLTEGFLGTEQSLVSESFSERDVAGKPRRLLDYPVYTRPEEFEGEKVPEILLSGDHERIEQWRQEQSLEKTRKSRPDLI